MKKNSPTYYPKCRSANSSCECFYPRYPCLHCQNSLYLDQEERLLMWMTINCILKPWTWECSLFLFFFFFFYRNYKMWIKYQHCATAWPFSFLVDWVYLFFNRVFHVWSFFCYYCKYDAFVWLYNRHLHWLSSCHFMSLCCRCFGLFQNFMVFFYFITAGNMCM